MPRHFQTHRDKLFESPINSTLSVDINDSYRTANETGNNTTQYFSMLEDSDTTTILNDISHNNLENDFTFSSCVPDETIAAENVVIIKAPNSDKWFSLQVAPDAEGNMQKYQYELVHNNEGQFECVPDTIQLLPFEPLSPAIGQRTEMVLDERSGDFLYTSAPEENFVDVGSQKIQLKIIQKNQTEYEPPEVYLGIEEPCTKQEQEIEETIQNSLGYHTDSVSQEECEFEVKNLDEMNMEGITVKQGILENALKGIYSPKKLNAEFYDNNKIEHIRIFVHADEEKVHKESKSTECKHKVPQGIKRTIALYPENKDSLKPCSKTITTIEIPPRRLVTPKLINIRKDVNPPLKSLNHLKHCCTPSQQAMSPEKENLAFKATNTPLKIQRSLAKESKTPAKKDWSVNRYTTQTKIIEAPVRQERLPRKQKIKPLDRIGEELEFQTVVVSSNGIVETKVDGVVKERKVLVPTECIQLTDSEDEISAKTRRKKISSRKKQIEIVISDSDDDTGTVDVQSCPIEETEESNSCKKCSKIFPSSRSLKTHMQHHALEEKKATQETAANTENRRSKHKCEKCNEVFINLFLLNKHTQLHNAKVKHECNVCRKLFMNPAQLTTHRRSHVKDVMYKCTNAPAIIAKDKRHSPKQKVPTSDKNGSIQPLGKSYKCPTCNANFISRVLLDMHVVKNCVRKSPRRATRSILPHTISQPSENVATHTLVERKVKANKVGMRTSLAIHQVPSGKINTTVAATGICTSASSTKRNRIPLNTGIPAISRVHSAFSNIKRKLKAGEDQGDIQSF